MFYLSLTILFILTLMGKVGEDVFMFIFGWLVTNFVGGNIAEWKYKAASLSGLNNESQSKVVDKVNFHRD